MKKCPFCGAELNDDNLFCSECGKSIPQGSVCPHCGASLNEGDVFCQSCGKRVDEILSTEMSETMQKKCHYCGTLINEGDVFCESCGKKVDDKNADIPVQQLQTFPDNGSLAIRWDGKWALVDTKIKMSINHCDIGEFSFKQGFETTIPITSNNIIVATKVGLMSATVKLELDPSENYTYELVYHRMSGWFGFILYDNDGNEIRRDKLHWGMWILSFLIPLAGFVYAIFGWKKRPASSYTSIYAALLGFIVTFTVSYSMENMRSELRSVLDNYKNHNNTTLVQDTDSIKDDLVINETEGISDADIQLIKNWYKYVLGEYPTENVMKKYLSPNVMQKIWEVDYEDTYSYWRFRTAAQDSKPDNDISEVEEITSEGGGWYTVTYKDMGWDGKTKLKVIDGKIVDFEKDVSWKSWDNEKVEDSKDNSASMDNANDAESQLHNFGYNSKHHHHLKGTFEDATGIYPIELDFNSSGREVSDVIYKNVKVGGIIRMTCTYFDFNNITVKGKDGKNDFTISLECINMNSFKGTAIDGSKEFVVKMEANCQHE